MTKGAKQTTDKAAAMLALSTQSRQTMRRNREHSTHTLLLLWGILWCLSFGLLWFAKATDTMSHYTALWLAFGITAIGIAATVVATRQENNDIKGKKQTLNTQLLWYWLVAVACIGVATMSLYIQRVDSETIVYAIQPLLSSLIIGLVLVISGISSDSKVATATGLWLVLLGTIAAFVGVPANLGILALGGGGGMVAIALVWRYWLEKEANHDKT